MRFLLDTNILIKVEPQNDQALEPDAAIGARFMSLVSGEAQSVFVHEAMVHDINRDSNVSRRSRSQFMFSKYHQLPYPPSAEPVYELLGEPTRYSNDWVDLQLAAAAQAGAVNYVVTQDANLRRKMRRIGLGDRCLDLSTAVDLLESLYDISVPPPPEVVDSAMYSLNRADPIWESFREDYDGFDEWWERSAEDGRPAWFVDSDGGYAAVAIGKSEGDSPHGIRGRVFKVCSFKVSEGSRGSKLGELLLKTIFRYVHPNDYNAVYVEVFAGHEDVVLLFDEFGFSPLEAVATDRGEVVLVKQLKQPDPPPGDMSELEYHVRYGPPALHPSARLYLVPIEPDWHELLFPDLEADLSPSANQMEFPGLEPHRTPAPYGNAIKKAYLSHANIRHMTGGSGLVFYRSRDLSAATTLGVIEKTLVSSDPEEIATFVGPRTVYTFEQITEMTTRGEVLSILFRHDRAFQPITLAELIVNGAARGAPQSISQVAPEGHQWLRHQMDA